MRARGWILTRSGEIRVVPEPQLKNEKIDWKPLLSKVPPGEEYPLMDQEPYRRHLIEEHDVFLYLPVEMELEAVPEETIEEILGEI